RDARRLDLAIGQPARLERLEAVVAERHVRPAPRLAGHAPALLLAVLHLLRHQHRNNPLVRWVAWVGWVGWVGLPVTPEREPTQPTRPTRLTRPLLRACLRTARRALSVLFLAAPLRDQAFTFVEPHLDPDLAVGGVPFGEAVVDVRAQRLQRQLAVQVPLGARDLGAVEPPRDAHLDAARAEAQRRLHRLGDQLGIELRLLDLLDVDEDLAAGLLLDLLLQLVDFRPLAADDDPRARGVDVDLQLVGGALGLDLRHAGVREALLERLAQRQILVQELGVIAIRVPARAPGLVEAEAESKRMNLLTHSRSLMPSPA